MSAYYIIATCVAVVTLLGAATAAGIAWGSLSAFQKSHEQRDIERFAEITGTLKEVRDDIKTILSTR